MWKANIILLKPAQIENDLDKINKIPVGTRYSLCSSDVDPDLRRIRTANNLQENAENLK